MGLACETVAPLSGVRLFTPPFFGDARGFFLELFNTHAYAAAGLDTAWAQTNLSHSTRGILRGLHYQLRHPQAKLVSCLRGAIFDVAVDIRRGSPSFGRWFGCVLDGVRHRQLFVPAGFAHGFCVLSEEAEVLYQCSDFYDPSDERGLAWNDPRLAIPWPLGGAAPRLSARDQRHPRLADADPCELPE